MKTNSVKTGSEKNVEMFKMTNDELATITGGGVAYEWVLNEDGEYVLVIKRGVKGSNH
ncbi:MAG TPA: bacteriocin [Bacteroidales bacterium]|nr:bacteriocin [Bacteroidales bacterium]